MVCQCLGQSHLEASYSTGEVTEVEERGWLGVIVWCDVGNEETEGQRWSLQCSQDDCLGSLLL